MGNSETKLRFKQAVERLGSNSAVEDSDLIVWEHLCQESECSLSEIAEIFSAEEIRALREEAPENLARFCWKITEKLVTAIDSSCRSCTEQTSVLNCCRLLTRIIPFIVEDSDWQSFFWSKPQIPREEDEDHREESSTNAPLGQSLLLAISDLLFCPEFTVSSSGNKNRDEVEELKNVDSCEYIWEQGVGFSNPTSQVPQHHKHRAEILKLLLVCFSQTIYLPPHSMEVTNPWVELFTSPQNKHALPIFTSLLNTVCGYEPSGYVPYNHLLWQDCKEGLVEMALQVLITALDNKSQDTEDLTDPSSQYPDNLFVNYLSRIHRDEDFDFILSGICRLLMNPLVQTYLPNSQRKVTFHQELLILFWKVCEINRRFLFFVLKSNDVLNILVPLLNYLNDSRADNSRIGLMHIGVFILLLLSGERNFGVRLNKPFISAVAIDIPVFSGSHADLLIIVFHKIITTGHQRLQPLFECLLTVLCNVSPYLKSLSMTAACKLIHLVEAFSTPWFLISNQSNHNLIFFLLEMLNNLIQYQFDGNSNLVFSIIRKRAVFHQLANLSSDCGKISKHSKKASNNKKDKEEEEDPSKRPEGSRSNSVNSQQAVEESMEGSEPAKPAQPGTLKASLMKIPKLTDLTEGVTAQKVAQQSNMAGVNSIRCTENSPQKESFSQPSMNKIGLRRWSDSSRQKSFSEDWSPTAEWVESWKVKLPLQIVMRLLQVLVPQVEKMCLDKGLTDEVEILKFLHQGTLVGLLPVPHPILIRRYQTNPGTSLWIRIYMWGVIYLRHSAPGLWNETDVRLFKVQKV